MLPPELAPCMIPFRPLFSKPVYRRALVLVVGAILAVRARTTAAVLRVMGIGSEKRFCAYQRVLSRARWSQQEAARQVLGALVERFAPAGPLVFGIDDTIERRRGARIEAKGIYRDPVRSSKGHFVKASGLRWLGLMLLAEIPWTKRVWTRASTARLRRACRGNRVARAKRASACQSSKSGCTLLLPSGVRYEWRPVRVASGTSGVR